MSRVWEIAELEEIFNIDAPMRRWTLTVTAKQGSEPGTGNLVNRTMWMWSRLAHCIVMCKYVEMWQEMARHPPALCWLDSGSRCWMAAPAQSTLRPSNRVLCSGRPLDIGGGENAFEVCEIADGQ